VQGPPPRRHGRVGAVSALEMPQAQAGRGRRDGQHPSLSSPRIIKETPPMRASTVSQMEIEPILVSIPRASAMIGRGVATIYALLGRGQLRAVKSDARTLVVVESLREYAAKLEADHPAQIAPPRKRKPQHLRQAKITSMR